MCRRSCGQSPPCQDRDPGRGGQGEILDAVTGAGAVTAIFAIFFLLLMIVYALALVVPRWTAALIVGAALAVVANVMLTVGVRRFKQIHPNPERTVETLKENVEWAKQHTK